MVKSGLNLKRYQKIPTPRTFELSTFDDLENHFDTIDSTSAFKSSINRGSLYIIMLVIAELKKKRFYLSKAKYNLDKS